MTHRVSVGPYTIEIPPNGVALLYEADEGGDDHLMPGGIGYLEALVQFAGEIIGLRAMVDTMRADRNEQDLALRDAIRETAQTADELAFWKYQAIYGRAFMLDASIIKRPLPEESPVWKEAERQLEAARVEENRERYAHAEAPRDPGAT